MRLLAFIRQRSFARFVAFDIAEAGRRLGWDVIWLDLDGERQRLAALPETERPAAADRLRARLSDLAPDLVCSYGLEAFGPVLADLVPAQRWTVAGETGSPVACFLFDFGYPFDVPSDPTAGTLLNRLRAPDVGVWCWDAVARADLAGLEIAAAPFPMAVNEQMFYPPAADAPRDLPLVFAGGPTSERIAALEPLVAHGLTVYGYDADDWRVSPGLRASHRGLVEARSEMRAMYQRARLTVNVTRPHGRDSLNMRVFEAMACGCLVLTDRAGAAAALFTPGEHLVTYGSADELDDCVRYYLAHDEVRRRIAEAGARVVATRHTYTARLRAIAEPLRALVVEGRAWRHFQQFLVDDSDKAARFFETLRATGNLRHERPWREALRASRAAGRQ